MKWELARKMAGDWPTCACGNQCAIIPRYAGGALLGGQPEDSLLATLGYKFSAAIKDGHWVTAKKILGAIERRSAHLVKQIHESARRDKARLSKLRVLEIG